jgi:uncharacterized protein with HEPN domain
MKVTFLDILRAALLAIEFRGQTDKAGLLAGLKTRPAVLRQFLTSGEAVTRLSPEFRAAHLEAPWRLKCPLIPR